MKKTGICLLAALMLVAVFAGCGNGKDVVISPSGSPMITTSPSVSPSDKLPEVTDDMMPDTEDGIVKDEDGIITEGDTGNGNQTDKARVTGQDKNAR